MGTGWTVVGARAYACTLGCPATRQFTEEEEKRVVVTGREDECRAEGYAKGIRKTRATCIHCCSSIRRLSYCTGFSLALELSPLVGVPETSCTRKRHAYFESQVLNETRVGRRTLGIAVVRRRTQRFSARFNLLEWPRVVDADML